MTTLMHASNQWATRPADQRFASLLDMRDAMDAMRNASAAKAVSSRAIRFAPAPGNELKGIQITGPNGHAYNPTHHSFGQLAQLAQAPAGYLRTLPAAMAADCLNYGIQFKRAVEDVGVLLRRMDGMNTLAAATGPNFGRVWNADIVDMLIGRFGDGITGNWRVPGEFGKRVDVTKANTTLFASDHDMFVFLADEDRRIDVPNRRNGQSGQMARGFFIWNGENGGTTLGGAFFLFDYVCCNRIVWGAEQFQEIRIRHTASAPDKWMENVVPVLKEYAEASAKPVLEAIEHAKQAKIDDDLQTFLAGRFTKSAVAAAMTAHEAEEGRPIETVWDAVTGLTAYARTIEHTDTRVGIEREAGKLLKQAA